MASTRRREARQIRFRGGLRNTLSTLFDRVQGLQDAYVERSIPYWYISSRGGIRDEEQLHLFYKAQGGKGANEKTRLTPTLPKPPPAGVLRTYATDEEGNGNLTVSRNLADDR